MEQLFDVVRLNLGAVFLVASVSKAWRPEATVAAAAALLGSDDTSRLRRAVYLLAVGEAVLGAAAMTGYDVRMTSWALTLALLCFCLVQIRLVGMGYTDSCGCFGTASNSPVHASLHLAITLLCTLGAAASPWAYADGLKHRPLVTVDVGVVVVATLVFLTGLLLRNLASHTLVLMNVDR